MTKKQQQQKDKTFRQDETEDKEQGKKQKNTKGGKNCKKNLWGYLKNFR